MSVRSVLLLPAIALLSIAGSPVLAQPLSESADQLYAQRADLTSARQAADLWRTALQRNPQDFEAAWKLARADYWLGGRVAQGDRKAFLENGIEAGETAATIEPNRPEGHFWMAANMGALAESFGLRAGLEYRTPVRERLERVLKIDPAFQQGSADRALGRWYFRVPRLFGGSRTRAEEHLRASLTYNPNSTASHFFLAEVLAADDRKAEARAELERVLDAPLDPEWTPEDQEFKAKAKAMLATLPS
jgi:tetratricopeptide (TPR) repeat protein